jgi:hypothetical protein
MAEMLWKEAFAMKYGNQVEFAIKILEADRQAVLDEAAERANHGLECEVSICESSHGSSGRDEQFEDGFIEGLRQARRIVRAAIKGEAQ